MKMKKMTTKTISVILAGTILLSGCASTTMIQSTPSGAKVYIDGEVVGATPYAYTDTKIVGSTTSVKLKKDGYETYDTYFSRNEQADVGAIVGGCLVWIPFLWTMKYKPTHTYELTPIKDNKQSSNNSVEKKENKSKVDRLRELKHLLDEGVITQVDYEDQKKKIIEE